MNYLKLKKEFWILKGPDCKTTFTRTQKNLCSIVISTTLLLQYSGDEAHKK